VAQCLAVCDKIYLLPILFVNCPLVGETSAAAGGVNVSVIAPTELRVDGVCCVGLSSHGTLLLHNPTTHWMHVQLAVTQIDVDGQPADHNISPFVVRPKVTIDPNSTESVKVPIICPLLIIIIIVVVVYYAKAAQDTTATGDF